MIDFHSLPPLASLRAFAAFVGAGSLVRAGEALNVSHAAVSQQLRALESHLGVALFDRSGQSLRLTAEGQLLAEATVAGFEGMVRAVDELTGRDAGRPLMVTTTSSFASGWLLPRLADFRARHPGIDLMIDPSPDLKALAPGGFDVALRYGSGDWPGLESELVLSTAVVIVAAPSLVGSGVRAEDLAALEGVPWLQELGTSEATDFMRRHGLNRSGRPGLTALPGQLMLDAARDGQGLAVVARAFVEADIAAGRLVQVFISSDRDGYFLVTRPGVLRPPARAFVAWVRRQAAVDPDQRAAAAARRS
jgi:LysR family glycine cleavage system transcriptional activator